MSALKILRSSSWFVAANALAGFFNYLFQVFASRELSAAEFSQLNAWFANLALFFLVGGLTQYAANFFPVSQKRARVAVATINVLCLGLAAAWIFATDGLTLSRALIILAGGSVFGWMVGQAQSRLLFLVMTVASLLVGASKVGLVFVSTVGNTSLERYAFALFACYLPALWWISVSVWNKPPASVPKKNAFSWKLWSAPLILSTASAVIPQMDMVLMNRIQPALDFQDFARASLFYKCIYFLMFIVAQWLLPQQIRAGQNASPLRSANGGWYGFALASVFASVALTLVSPFVSAYILGWDHAPAMSLIFLSCLNISLLTWVFFEIQSGCAKHRIRGPAVALAGLGIEGVIQLALALGMNSYLILACLIQAILIAFLRLMNLYPKGGQVL